MKKLFGLLAVFFLSSLSVLSADMRFVQVDGALYNSASSERFEALIQKINSEKDVDFVVFTGNNISKPCEYELKRTMIIFVLR